MVFLLFSISFFAQNDSNKMDANGKKLGLWKGVYENSKQPRYEGTFDHDKEIGLFKFFDDSKASNLIATREFNSKDNSAYTIFYDENKNKISEGNVLNKLYEGLWIYYHKASKTIMTSENYKNGKLDGTKKINYPSGKVAEISNFKNGIRNGIYKKFSEDGIELEDSFYSNAYKPYVLGCRYKRNLGRTVTNRLFGSYPSRVSKHHITKINQAASQPS
jgi:antitoxin component YwqK of YwqJK toxin-antitoxin module